MLEVVSNQCCQSVSSGISLEKLWDMGDVLMRMSVFCPRSFRAMLGVVEEKFAVCHRPRPAHVVQGKQICRQAGVRLHSNPVDGTFMTADEGLHVSTLFDIVVVVSISAPSFSGTIERKRLRAAPASANVGQVETWGHCSSMAPI